MEHRYIDLQILYTLFIYIWQILNTFFVTLFTKSGLYKKTKDTYTKFNKYKIQTVEIYKNRCELSKYSTQLIQMTTKEVSWRRSHVVYLSSFDDNNKQRGLWQWCKVDSGTKLGLVRLI